MKIGNKNVFEPVKHKPGMLRSFGDVSIEDGTKNNVVAICRHCGGVDYTVNCPECRNDFSSAQVECPHCRLQYDIIN